MAIERFQGGDSGILIVGFRCSEVGDQLPPHIHPHGHFFFCAYGGFDLWDGGKTEHVPTFGHTWIPEYTPHSARATAVGSVGICVQYLRDIDGSALGKDADKLSPFERFQAGTRLVCQ